MSSDTTDDTPKLKGGPFVHSPVRPYDGPDLPQEVIDALKQPSGVLAITDPDADNKPAPPAWAITIGSACGVILQAAFTVGLIGILLAATVRATRWILGF